MVVNSDMKNSWWKQKEDRIVLITAGVLAILAAAVVLYAGRPTGTDTYKIVCLGDSIIGNYKEDSAVEHLSDRLKVPVLNGAFGGTAAAVRPDEIPRTCLNQTLSLAELADAIAWRDFAAQKAEVAYGSAYEEKNRQILGYFQETLEHLEKVDFTETEILLIEHGTNDYNSGTVLDNPENPYDSHTFGGALRHAIRVLRKQYPNLRIILITPSYCYFKGSDHQEDCMERDFGYGTLQAYVDLEIAIAEECGVEVIDNLRGLGIHKENREEYLEDGLHLNTAGRKLLADHVADYLLETE